MKVRVISIGIILAVLVLAAIRFCQNQDFRNERSAFSQVQIDFRFEDALSDPRTCSVTPLGSLTLFGDGSFEFKFGLQNLRGNYDASEMGLHLNRFRKLEYLVEGEPQVSHSTGYQVDVHFDNKRWSGAFHDFNELSPEDLWAAYSSGSIPGLSKIKGDDLVGTFVMNSLNTLPREDRKEISEAMAESFSEVDLRRLSEVWPVAHWKTIFFQRIEQRDRE